MQIKCKCNTLLIHNVTIAFISDKMTPKNFKASFKGYQTLDLEGFCWSKGNAFFGDIYFEFLNQFSPVAYQYMWS